MLNMNDQVRLFELNFAGEDLPEDLFEKLYEHYTSNGEMPYGVAKARTGDPYEWILAKIPEYLAERT